MLGAVRVAIYQPQYFPRLHYVNRALDADVFVLLASAQYTKTLVHLLPDGGRERHKSYQSHAPIKQHDGEHLLTVPVSRGHQHASLAEALPDDGHAWRRQHLNTLKAAYGRAPWFAQRFAEVERLLERTQGWSLAGLNTATLLWALDVVLDLDLGVDGLSLEAVDQRLDARPDVRLRRVLLDAEVGVERPEGRQMGAVWTAAIAQALGADEYLHGATAGSGYMDLDVYRDRGIAPVEQDWQGPPYPQLFEDRTGFLPNLSVLDLLFNVDPNEALDVLQPTADRSATPSVRSHR